MEVRIVGIRCGQTLQQISNIDRLSIIDQFWWFMRWFHNSSRNYYFISIINVMSRFFLERTWPHTYSDFEQPKFSKLSRAPWVEFVGTDPTQFNQTFHPSWSVTLSNTCQTYSRQVITNGHEQPTTQCIERCCSSYLLSWGWIHQRLT